MGGAGSQFCEWHLKKVKEGIRSKPYNSSRVFSTVTPEFIVADEVTNRPILTAGERLKSTREDWVIDSVNRRKAKRTNI